MHPLYYKSRVANKMNIVDLIERTNLCKSRSEIKRLIGQGGIYVDGIRVKNTNTEVYHIEDKETADILNKQYSAV